MDSEKSSMSEVDSNSSFSSSLKLEHPTVLRELLGQALLYGGGVNGELFLASYFKASYFYAS